MIPSQLVRAAFLADSHCLGPHWVYNQEELARLYPDRLKSLDAPHSKYHSHRSAGQFTHYGDQMLILLKSIALSGTWSAKLFRQQWFELMKDYDGYRDGATKGTLETIAEGQATPGSQSNDLAGASRIFPLFLLELPLDDLVKAAREQTALTHGDAQVVDCAEFFARTVTALQRGQSVPEALEKAASATYQALPAKQWLEQARAQLESEPNAATSNFGLTCHLPEAFPATLYFALRWHAQGADRREETFLKTLSDNALAGGDNAARGIPLAAMMAASGANLPAKQWKEVEAAKQIEALEFLIAETH
ncbi:MAG: ADP-ribosylglycohydrolase family protein [Verrucomicrobiota bacterium JB023]|nr:ADP-ribosylglycohydrolase family protein [Verrucomicrobiota bacterium JB023]